MSRQPPKKKSRFFSEGRSKMGSVFGRNNGNTNSQSSVPASSASDASSMTPDSSFTSATSGSTEATSFQSTGSSFGANSDIHKYRPALNVSFPSEGTNDNDIAPDTPQNRMSFTASALSNLAIRDTRRDGVYGPQSLAHNVPSSIGGGCTNARFQGPPDVSLGSERRGGTKISTATPDSLLVLPPIPYPEFHGPPYQVYRISEANFQAARADAQHTGRPIESYFKRFPVAGEPFYSRTACQHALFATHAAPGYRYQLLSTNSHVHGQHRPPASSYPPLARGYQAHPVHGQCPFDPKQVHGLHVERQTQAQRQTQAASESEGPLGSMAAAYIGPSLDDRTSNTHDADPVRPQPFPPSKLPTSNPGQLPPHPIPNLDNHGITSLPVHATLTPRRRPTTSPTLYDSPDRLFRAIASATLSRKRKRPEHILPPPAYMYERTNNPNFNIFSGILLYPEIVFHLAAQLTVNDLVSLYAVSRDFHTIIDARFTTVMLSQSLGKCPDASRAFHFRSYGYLCRPDPATRPCPHPDPQKAKQGMRRMVPSMRWLKMVLHREKVVHELMAVFAEDGVPLPPRCKTAIMRVWFLMDIPDNGRRIGFIHQRAHFSDVDLYFAICFFIKLDMRCNDPVAVECRHGMRKMLLAQRSCLTLLRVLKRDIWVKQIDVMRAWIRYRYDILEDEVGMSIFGVPAQDVGKLRYEWWGQKTEEQAQRKVQSLLRPDQLVMREAVRRGLRFNKHFLKSVLYGYIHLDQLENYEPRNMGRRIARLEDEYGHDDEIGGAEIPVEGGDDILDMGERREVSTLCIRSTQVGKNEMQRRLAEDQWLRMCREWSKAEREDLMQIDA